MAKLRFTMEYLADGSEEIVPKWGFIIPLRGEGDVGDITPELIEEAMLLFQRSIGNTDVQNWAKDYK